MESRSPPIHSADEAEGRTRRAMGWECRKGRAEGSAEGPELSVSPVGFGAPGKQSGGLFSAKNGRQPRAFVEDESEAEAQ